MVLNYEKAQADYDAGLVDAYLDGIDEGEARGEAIGEANGLNKAIQIMRLLRQGEKPESIALQFNLTAQQVNDLLG